MIFSEAVNIAEDLVKAQTEGELEGLTSFTEVPVIDEVAATALISDGISSTGDATPLSNSLSPEFDGRVLADGFEEIPLSSVTDSEPAVAEDSGEESSDEEALLEEEIPDPAMTEPTALPEIVVSEPPSTTTTEPSPSETASDGKEPEPAQPISEAMEHPAEVGVTSVAADDDEDVERDEEDAPLAPGPSPPQTADDDDEDDDDDGENDDDDDNSGSQPANQLEVGP